VKTFQKQEYCGRVKIFLVVDGMLRAAYVLWDGDNDFCDNVASFTLVTMLSSVRLLIRADSIE